MAVKKSMLIFFFLIELKISVVAVQDRKEGAVQKSM